MQNINTSSGIEKGVNLGFPRLVVEFEPSVFHELFDFQIARVILDQLGPAVTALGDVICEHNLHTDVAVNLLHKHFDIRKFEVVVRKIRDGKASIQPYKYKDDKSLDLLPYLWQYTDGPRGRLFYPLEYAEYLPAEIDAATRQIDKIASSKSFLAEFSKCLWDLGLEDIFGIAALESRRSLIIPSGHELLETTDSKNRVLTLEAVAENTLADSDTTETLWTFTPSND